MLVSVRVHPGASREEVAVREGRMLKVWVRRPPADGQANRAVEELLAERLGLARTAARIIRGASGRVKTVELPLERWEQVVERLAAR
jgi:uncharacterized protein YggU (UPF0235/DUF167 family)